MNETGEVLPFAVPPVVKTVTVRCPPAVAFRRFTEELGTWWPLATHHLSDDPQLCVLEGRMGGRLFERGKDGTEKVWGVIELWDPPHRLAFTWQVKVSAGQAQRIDVTFAAAPGGTRVELVHSGWEKLGDAAAARRENYDEGWGLVFEQCYADYADAGSTA